MQVSTQWMSARGADFGAGAGKTGYACLTHYNAEYCEWGEGPPLVLVPGLAGSYGLLGSLARLLAPHYRVISYHLRGEDDCFALRRPFGLTDLAEDLAEFLDWHYLERPIVFGVSFGGAVALEFAARYPQRLQQLIVQGCGARLERGLLQQVASLVLSRFPLPADNPFVNQFFNLLFGGRQPEGPLFHFVTRQCWRTDQSVIAHRFRQIEQFNLEARLPRVQTPTLILSGDRDMLVSERSAFALQDGVAQSVLVQLRGCGHLACVTHPEHLALETRRFVALTHQESC